MSRAEALHLNHASVKIPARRGVLEGYMRRERITKVLCWVSLAVCFGLAFWGRPPALGQTGLESANTGRGATVEDALQDQSISEMKARLEEQRLTIQSLDTQAREQGERLAVIENELKGGGAILGILNAWGLVLSNKRKNALQRIAENGAGTPTSG